MFHSEFRNDKGKQAIVQPKLTIGQPGDKYEQEADAMADKVMRMPQTDAPIQRQCEECEEGALQMKPLAASITPIIQKQGMEEEEEMLQAKSEGGEMNASASLSSQLSQSKGGGTGLPKTTNQHMSNAFGTDFSGVRVHTDANAVQMNRALGARAFTHGSDVYFNEGEYSPNSSKGKRLLGHELTHVVQQGNVIGSKIGKMPSSITPSIQRIVDPISAAGLGVAVFGLVSGYVILGIDDLLWHRNVGRAIHNWPEGQEPGQEHWLRDWSTPILRLNMISGASSSWAMFYLMRNYNGADIDQAHVTKFASSDWNFSGGDITFEMQDASASYEEGGKAAMICYINGSLDPLGDGDIDFEGRVLLLADGTVRKLGDLQITRGDESDFTINWDPDHGGWTVTKN